MVPMIFWLECLLISKSKLDFGVQAEESYADLILDRYQVAPASVCSPFPALSSQEKNQNITPDWIDVISKTVQPCV